MDIQGYFNYIINKHETLTDNPPIRIYINKIESIITLTIRTGSYLEVLTPEAMKLLGRIKKKIINDTQYPIQYTIFNIQLTGHIYGI